MMPETNFAPMADANPFKNRSSQTRMLIKTAGWRLALLLSALPSPHAVAQPAAAAPRTIRVAMDNDYAPYSFQAGDGRLQGILVDQWRVWEKQTGIKVEIRGMDWSEALQRMRAGEFDVIDEIVETPERREYFDFTPAYATISVPIFFRSDISGITDLASLQGFPVGVKEGDQHADKLKASGVTTLIPFRNDQGIIAAARQHKINVFVVDAPAALYLLNKAGIEAEFRRSAPIFQDDLQRAVRKGNAALLSTVSSGFAAIAPDQFRKIDEKWLGRPISLTSRYLTYAGWTVAVAILLVAGLGAWNRMLRKKILQRTAALAESEERFRQIAENIHEVFWLATIDFGKTLYVSPAYETIWGRTCESLYQEPRSFLEAIHPEDRARVIEVLATECERGFELEYRVVRANGSFSWIRDRRFPIRDGAAQPYRIAGIARDITDRKLAVEAVRQAEDRIRLVINTIPTMAWSVRPDGIVDFVNQRWLDYTGLSMEEEIAQPTRAIHPEDLPRIMEKWPTDMASGNLFEDEMRLRRADGEYRWFFVRTAPLRDEHGVIVKWFGSSFDVEDRKQAEMQWRVLIDAIPHQIWSCSPDGIPDYCNARWRSYTGLVLEDLPDAGWQTIIHPDDRSQVAKAWAESVTKGTPYEQEERHRGADGAYRWFLGRGVPLRNAEGRIVRWYGTNTDIEDRKKAVEALRLSEQQLLALVDRLNTVREDEAKRIARELHDVLGQKLTALSMELTDLETKLADATPNQRAQIAQMNAVVDDTIEVVQELSSELRLGQLDVLGLTAAIEWQLKEFSQRSKIPCKVTRLDEITHLSDAHNTAVFRILQEALTNIVRHAGAKEVEINLQAGPSQLVLRVHDNGRGITMAELTDRKAIGLLGMRERAQIVGGAVTITGGTGRGTTVVVTVPLKPAAKIPA
ncbi:MAG: domain S-box-containing protein [Verrucomicrobia bacterium]|nr:domain S-box-containing protein [Verrucomicrobiota bacterium]